MPVAKTYESFPQCGEPFKESGRMYVLVETPKGEKKVRWYSDTEYQRMYPSEEVSDLMDFDARYAFGFREPGYITIYRGDITEFAEEHHEFFWHNLTFNYYTPSHIQVPPLPEGIEAIKLKWEEVQDHDNRMKPHEEVIKYLATNNLSPMSGGISKFQGEVGTWIETEVTVEKKKTSQNHFGEKRAFRLVDSEGNVYIWETSAKDFETNMVLHLKMKVKEHKEIDGEECTIVWYCKEV